MAYYLILIQSESKSTFGSVIEQAKLFSNKNEALDYFYNVVEMDQYMIKSEISYNGGMYYRAVRYGYMGQRTFSITLVMFTDADGCSIYNIG